VDTIITARAKAFSTESARVYRFRVQDGVVMPWDSVAGYFTNCHSLTPSQMARIRKIAGL